MILINKEDLTEKLVNNSLEKNTNQLIAIYMKIRNDKLYFTTPKRYETGYKDLITINPNTYDLELYDTKSYLKTLFCPALVSDKDVKEIRSYLTHLTGNYGNLKRNMLRKDLDKVTERIIHEEMNEKENLKQHYRIE